MSSYPKTQTNYAISTDEAKTNTFRNGDSREETDLKTENTTSIIIPNDSYKPYKRGKADISEKQSSSSDLLIYIAGFFMVTTVVFGTYAVLLKTVWKPTPEESPSTYCFTEACMNKAMIVIDAMNTTVEPCDDFFEYACGNWHRRNPIPENRDRLCTFVRNGNQVKMDMKALLEQPSKPSEPTAVVKARTVYKACIKRDENDDGNIDSLLTTLKELGGWPVLKQETGDESYDVEQAMANVARLGRDTLLTVSADIDLYDASTFRLYIDQGRTVLSRAYYVDHRYNDVLVSYRKFVTDVVTLIGVSETRAKSEADKIVDFEVEIAKIMVPYKYRKNWKDAFNVISYEELTSLKSGNNNFNWDRFLAAFTAGVKSESGAKIEFGDRTPICLFTDVDYITRVIELINRTPARVVTNYLVWKLVYKSIPNLSKKRFSKVLKNFVKDIWNYEYEYGGWKSCMYNAEWTMKWATGRMYVDKHFNAETKVKATEMVEDIRSALIKMMSTVSWMSKEARIAAMEKGKLIKTKIGYPDFILDDDKLNSLYEDYDVSDKDSYSNIVMTWRHLMNEMISKLNQPVNIETRWDMQITAVNAWYEPVQNEIVVPAAMLRPPFYHKDYPRYSNYAGIGFLIGHELSHGFDNFGRQFDKDGNLKNWWGNETIAKFIEKTNCFREKYSNFTLPDPKIKINGNQTLNENLADTGAIRESYLAYTEFVQREGKPELLLPGKKWTIDQLFFLNVAQGWCENIRPGVYKQYWVNDAHSPDKYRVLGSLQSSAEFARAYNCPVGSNMNPVNRCTIWK